MGYVCHGVYLLALYALVSWCVLIGLCVYLLACVSWCVLVGLCVMVHVYLLAGVCHGVYLLSCVCHGVYLL